MKCLYHGSDMDGWSSAAIVSFKTGNNNPDNYIPVDYDKNTIESIYEDKLKEVYGEDIYISDVSFSSKTAYILIKLINNKNNVIWNDHHDTSLKLLEEQPQFKTINGIISKDNSGAYNTWSYLFNTTPPVSICLVSDWDTFKLNDSRSINFMYGINSNPEYKNPLSKLWENLILSDKDTLDVIHNGILIKQYVDEEYKSIINSCGYESEYDGVKCYVVNHPHATSLIFGDIYNKYDFVSVFSYNGEKYKYSIYSGNRYDCSKLAEKFGGGGHKGAAGFSHNELIFKKLGE